MLPCVPVTVSIGEETNGDLRVMLRVKREEMSTSGAAKSMNPGKTRKSL